MASPQLKMRRTLDDFEQAFVEESVEDRVRLELLRRNAQQRARRREVERTNKRGTVRFALLVLALITTAFIVTVVMFRVLYVVMG